MYTYKPPISLETSLQASRLRNKSIENLKQESRPVSSSVFSPKTKTPEPPIPLFQRTFRPITSKSSKYDTGDTTSAKLTGSNVSKQDLYNVAMDFSTSRPKTVTSRDLLRQLKSKLTSPKSTTFPSLSLQTSKSLTPDSIKHKSIENLKGQDSFRSESVHPKSKNISTRPKTAISTSLARTFHKLTSPSTPSPTTPKSEITYDPTDIVRRLVGETESDYYDYTNDIITNDFKYNEHLEIISKLITFYVLNGCKINTDKTGYLLYEVKLKKYKDLEKEPGGEKKVQTMIVQNFQNLVRYNKLLNDVYTLIHIDNLEYNPSKLEIIKQAKLKLTDFESQLKEKIKKFFREDPKLKEYKITIATISPIIKSLKNFEYLAKDEEGKYYKKSAIMNGLIYLLKHVEADLKQKGGKGLSKKKVVSKKRKVVSKKKKVSKKKVVSKKKKVSKKKVVSKKRKLVSKKRKVVSKKKTLSKKRKVLSKKRKVN
jgi:hypothetical protein